MYLCHFGLFLCHVKSCQITSTKVARFSLCTKKRRLIICKNAVFTYVRKPVHKGENCLTKWWLTLQDQKLVHNGPISTILVPIDSQGPGLFLGTKMVKIGPLLTKLWPCKVNHHFVEQYSLLCMGFGTDVKTAYLHINSRRFFVHKEKRTPLINDQHRFDTHNIWFRINRAQLK